MRVHSATDISGGYIHLGWKHASDATTQAREVGLGMNLTGKVIQYASMIMMVHLTPKSAPALWRVLTGSRARSVDLLEG